MWRFAATADRPLLGRARPGQKLAFRWVRNEEAVERHREAERELALLEDRVGALFDVVRLPRHREAAAQPAA